MLHQEKSYSPMWVPTYNFPMKSSLTHTQVIQYYLPHFLEKADRTAHMVTFSQMKLNRPNNSTRRNKPVPRWGPGYGCWRGLLGFGSSAGT